MDFWIPKAAEETGGERCDVDRGEAETGHHDAGDQPGLGGGEPFEGRGGGRRIAETETGAGQDAETDDPGQ